MGGLCSREKEKSRHERRRVRAKHRKENIIKKQYEDGQRILDKRSEQIEAEEAAEEAAKTAGGAVPNGQDKTIRF